MNPLVLASGSPRRISILKQLGLNFVAFPAPDTEIIPRPGVLPEDYCRRCALEKAISVQKTFPDRVILAADTVVVADRVILGKPADREKAKVMLLALSGKTHRVITGVALISPGHQAQSDVEVTHVRFRVLSYSEIEWYLNSDDGNDKAGGYGIQSLGAALIHSISGCYYNVVGLPVTRVIDLLASYAPDYWPPK